MKTKIKQISLFVLAAYSLLLTANVYAKSNVEAFADDTIAGYSTVIETTKVKPNADLTILVKKPDGNEVAFGAKANENGVAEAELYDYHTKKAGTYYVGAAMKGENDFSFNAFDVYPDKVSIDDSLFKASRQMVHVGDGKTELLVGLKDKNGNAIANHEVMIVSSRSKDVIAAKNGGITDFNGNAVFEVNGEEAGLSTYTAYDGTEGVSLNDRIDVVYYNGNGLANAGGDLESFNLVPTAYAQSIAGGPVDGFEIEGLDSQIKVNENVTFTVKAVDADKNVSENYSGKIHFSVEGASASDVTIPDDYQFAAEDLGAHTFSLGLSFKSAGAYKMVITDLDNTELRGESTVNVVSGGGSDSGSNTSSGGLAISSPKAGTYNVSKQTIVGTATPGIALKVYDNDQEIGNVDADAQGNFSFETSNLKDGEHKLKVVELDAQNNPAATSGIVTIKVDTSGPQADQITFDPDGPVAPGSLVKITIFSDNNLAQAAMILNGDLTVLTEDIAVAGTYKGSFVAPEEVGTYGIDIILVDALGNESQLQNQKQLVVAERGAVGDASLDGTDNVDVLGGGDAVEVGAVTGLKAFSGNGRVNLEWKAVDGSIANYRVYYGLRADALVNAVDTFTADAKWYVPNLENGTEYFFALTAINADGNESAVRSEIVSAVPFEPTETGLANDNGIFTFEPSGLSDVVAVNATDLKEAPLEKDELDKTGPEVYYLMILSLLGAVFFNKMRKV